MARKLQSCHSKSTSDISDDIVNNNEAYLRETSFLMENRYRTYTFEDFKEDKECFASSSTCEEKKESTQKSQNFVKKLIASLERKNEVCKANDEFYTKYYRTNDYSNPDRDYSFNKKLQVANKFKKAEMEILVSNETVTENCKPEHNFKSNLSTEKTMSVLPTVERRQKIPSESHNKNGNMRKSIFENSKNKGKNGIAASEQRNTKRNSESYVTPDIQRNTDINCNNQKKKCDDASSSSSSSSFNPSQSRVELQNRRDSANFYFMKRNDDHKRKTTERIVKNSKEGKCSDKKMYDSFCRKKLNRNRSFKDFFGSMIKWKKSESKEKPRRYLSCDNLLDETKPFGFKNSNKLPRVSSIQTVVFHDYEEDNNFAQVKQSRERNATIRPIYGGKRNKHHLEGSAKKKEDRSHFRILGNVEDFVKPSAIKDTAKHLSQLPPKPRIANHINERRKQIDRKYD